MIKQLNKNYFNVKLYMWLSALFFSLFFIFFPQIDIQTSALFYDGHSFYLKGSLFERFFYNSVKIMLISFTLGSISIYFYNKIKKKNILGVNGKVMLYIILVLSIAPGLIVNATLKDYSYTVFILFVGFLLSRKRHKFWISLAISYGVLIGLARLITGDYFLSDIFTSFFFIWIVIHTFYKIIFKKDSTL